MPKIRQIRSNSQSRKPIKEHVIKTIRTGKNTVKNPREQIRYGAIIRHQ